MLKIEERTTQLTKVKKTRIFFVEDVKLQDIGFLNFYPHDILIFQVRVTATLSILWVFGLVIDSDIKKCAV